MTDDKLVDKVSEAMFNTAKNGRSMVNEAIRAVHEYYDRRGVVLIHQKELSFLRAQASMNMARNRNFIASTPPQKGE